MPDRLRKTGDVVLASCQIKAVHFPEPGDRRDGLDGMLAFEDHLTGTEKFTVSRFVKIRLPQAVNDSPGSGVSHQTRKHFLLGLMVAGYFPQVLLNGKRVSVFLSTVRFAASASP